ncbi:hypothetical protein HGRIS_004071 [Hohenbuehelia grisea]|uniref:Uncharacterized protein n=1 Tax=Hohenbuehelia grisea TaxID=104357 RepID=A0ABR3JIK2_9AGAR
MVTSRRKPIAPVLGPGSRTNSTQGVQRSVKTKGPVSEDGTSRTNGQASQLTRELNPESSKSEKSSKSKDKHKKKKKKSKEPSLMHMLSRIVILLTTIYAYLACPNSPIYTPQSASTNSLPTGIAKPLPLTPHLLLTPFLQGVTSIPPPHPLVCQAVLKTHNRIVLPFQTYVLQPASHKISSLVHSAAYSPTLSPYTTSAVNFYEGPLLRFYHSKVVPTYIHILVPAYHKHVLPRVSAYLIQPLWHKGAKPLWRNSVVPAYHRYIVRDLWQVRLAPVYYKYLYNPLAPYARASQRVYRLHIHPNLARLASESEDAYSTYLEPVLERAAAHAKVIIAKAYDHACIEWKRVRPHLVVAWKEVDAKSSVVLRKVAEQRRIYVDRHVARIWEEVRELSGVRRTPERSSITPTKVVAAHTVDIEAEYSSVAPPVLSDEPARSAASVIEESLRGDTATASVADVASASVMTTSVASEESIAAPPAAVTEAVDAEAAAVRAQLHDEGSALEAEFTSVAPPVLDDGPKRSAASVIAESLLAPSPSATESAADVDLDDFFADLGIDSNAPPSKSADIPEPSPEPTQVAEEETEDQKRALAEQAEARKAETVIKRADIESRHRKWESQLESLIREQDVAVRSAIEGVRQSAAAAAAVNGGKFTKDIDSMAKEGEKLVKGASGWVTAHEKAPYNKANRPDPNFPYDEESVNKARERDMALFDQIMSKMEQKFGARVEQIEEIVNTWLASVREDEFAQVLQAEQQVKAIADQAQADLGLDYAWLDDVTYADWQRYHDLMRRTYRPFDLFCSFADWETFSLFLHLPLKSRVADDRLFKSSPVLISQRSLALD